jgi:hypothetical protein
MLNRLIQQFRGSTHYWQIVHDKVPPLLIHNKHSPRRVAPYAVNQFKKSAEVIARPLAGTKGDN